MSALGRFADLRRRGTLAGVPISPSTLSQTIARELDVLKDPVSVLVRSLLVHPTVSMRPWDYGTPGTFLPCWIVLVDEASETEIAYCEEGFGPSCPWGLFHTDPAKSMGMDSGWFPTFTEALFDSFVVTGLPIWCVAKDAYSLRPTMLDGPMSWEAAWEMVYSLRESDHGADYGCIDCGVR